MVHRSDEGAVAAPAGAVASPVEVGESYGSTCNDPTDVEWTRAPRLAPFPDLRAATALQDLRYPIISKSDRPFNNDCLSRYMIYTFTIVPYEIEEV